VLVVACALFAVGSAQSTQSRTPLAARANFFSEGLLERQFPVSKGCDARDPWKKAWSNPQAGDT
jgi:hypothetical protein